MGLYLKINSFQVKYVLPIIAFMLLCIGSYSYAQSSELRKLAQEAYELYAKGDYDESEYKCWQLLEKDPNFFYAYNILGSIYGQKKGFEEESIKYFEKSLSLRQAQPDIYNSIASLYNSMFKVDKAISYLEKGLSASPNNFNLNYNLGLSYLLGKKDPYKAIEFLDIAQKIRPDYPRLIYMNAVTHVFIDQEPIALEGVTKLRELKNEYLASQLEGVIRKYNENRNLDVGDVMQTYSEQPKKTAPDAAVIVGSQKKNDTPPQHEEKNSEVSINSPTMQIKGTGTVTIENRYRPQ